MNVKNPCPCCSNTMLRHLSASHSYWYCSSCRIEMPNIERQGAQHKILASAHKKHFLSESEKPTVSVS